ncbi:hypothetical protein NC652_037033 [Populus alba x Populus x berolinensis]|nr:hypothetical protein NC652_037033 [Populus alba x Populus x berolinensis]
MVCPARHLSMSTLMSVMLRKNISFFQDLALLLLDVILLSVSAIRYSSALHSRRSNIAAFRRSSLTPSMAAPHDGWLLL